ncbi:hypothetical protein CPB86DRAFT_278983 [Serendipita vermifera]|nr:hypothetical protein CPB86DRAFT_278983 [Serendipita vermifera]
MPVKIRRTASRNASSTNIGPKMAFAPLNPHQHQPNDKDVEKPIRKRTNSSQGIAHHQPKPFSRTTSLSKFPNKSTISQNPGSQAAVDSQPTDDDDWVSSSSAVASPAPEPEDEEEDEPIYVNQNVNSRAAHRGSPPATPTRTTHNLPHRRHNPSQAVPPAAEASTVPSAGPSSNARGRSTAHHQNQVATESDHIHFARAADLAPSTHHQDPRIHQNGKIYHASPPANVMHDEPTEMEPSSSVVRIASERVPEPLNRSANTNVATNGKNGQRSRADENSNKRSSAQLRQDQIDTLGRQITSPHTVRSAVSGNEDAISHATEGDKGTTSQRGFNASPSPGMQTHRDTLPPASPSTLGPSTPSHITSVRPRPSLLRRDTTPTAISRVSVAVDTPPRAQTPPPTLSRDEMIAVDHKRHSIHSGSSHRRPASMLGPSGQSKRHSLAGRPTSQYGHNNPLSLLLRLNNLQSSVLTAAPAVAVSPSTDGDHDGQHSYMSLSPTVSRANTRLRKKGSAASLNTVATAPVTSSATATGSSASPTSALATTSSAILSNIASKPQHTKRLSITSRADSRPDIRRSESSRLEDNPWFVSQFYSSDGPLSGKSSKRSGRLLGQAMMGDVEWKAHETAMRYRGPMIESLNRMTATRTAVNQARS